MRDLAIDAAQVTKCYQLGVRDTSATVGGILSEALSAPFRYLARIATGRRSSVEPFWALRDVSFQIGAGEVVGIIGRNGAGKSTLLKVLSRIVEPTSGRITLRGRVASLLEVGTGFHPELSGRENIYLNGAILGMRRHDIQRRFDEIVQFAEIEAFLDTPVKRYSSGMHMRLAFAVAAHLEPDILLVDEVLAVGDASFQRKCLNKMDSVGRQGRTIFFVSHNMPAITRLCQRAIMFDKGRVVEDGPAAQVTSAYLRSGVDTVTVREWADPAAAPTNGVATLRAVRIRSRDDDAGDTIDVQSPVAVEMDYDVIAAGRVLAPTFHFFNEEGVCIFVVRDDGEGRRDSGWPCGSYRSTVTLPANFLSEGMINVGAAISVADAAVAEVWQPEVVAFQVVDRGDGASARGDYAGALPGVVRPLLPWTTVAVG